jgi:hypothetical protein
MSAQETIMRTLLPSTLLLGALLAACGGGNHDDVALTPPPSTPVGGTAAADMFTTQIAGLVASASDDAEPADVDDTAATMPENAEPRALP